MSFDRKMYFDEVRATLFGGALTQQQVDGQEIILSMWENSPPTSDLRWLAYMLATTKHETAHTMWPIEEYGKGAGHSYGETDSETGEKYYGRGFVQLTWKDNYKKMGPVVATDLLNFPSEALDPRKAAIIMFAGMEKGIFRKGHTLEKYFSTTQNDAFNARDIINGDKNTMQKGATKTIGATIRDYHVSFLSALKNAQELPEPEPEREAIIISVPKGTKVIVEEY